MSVCLYRYVHAVVARVRFVCVRLHEIYENVCIRWYMYHLGIPVLTLQCCDNNTGKWCT